MRATHALLRSVLVVESPSKVNSIRKLLAETAFADWAVVATRGHVASLSELDTVTLTPEWEFAEDKVALLNKIVALSKEDSKKPGMVYIATDPDREGELIAKHVAAFIEVKGVPARSIARVAFNEVTKSAVTSAMAAPGRINMKLVDAGITRKMIDMWFGFAASNALMRDTKFACRSAGRVQSPALAIVAAREEEIANFNAESFMNVVVAFQLPGEKRVVQGSLMFTPDAAAAGAEAVDKKGKGKQKKAADADAAKAGKVKPTVRFDEKSAKLATDLVAKHPTFTAVTRTSEEQAEPPAFLDTAGCLKDASKALKMKVDEVTRCLQKLFEGGYITYIRTDSTDISAEAATAIHAHITDTYGPAYALPPRAKKPAKKAAKVVLTQEAHEAIRPTRIEDTGARLSGSEKSVYEFVHQRTLQAAMPRPRYAKQTITLTSKAKLNGNPLTCQIMRRECTFNGSDVLGKAKGSAKDAALSAPVKGAVEVAVAKVKAESTRPPAPMTSMDLIDTMKKKGIGRPSTYNPTLQTLVTRSYLTQSDASVLAVTDAGRKARAYMARVFARYVNLGYTAEMEADLDAIAKGKATREWVLRQFRQDFGEVYAKVPQKHRKWMMNEDGVNFWAVPLGKTVEMGDTGRMLEVDAATFKSWPEGSRVAKMLEHGSRMRAPKGKGDKAPSPAQSRSNPTQPRKTFKKKAASA